MSKDRLDDAIDRAVREMLDVEPPAGLRGRVLDRIENTRTRGWSWIWVAGPLAAAAILVLAVLAPWRSAAPMSVTSNPPSTARVEPRPIVPTAASPATQDSPGTARIPLRPSPPPARQPSARAVDERMVSAAVVPADDASVIDPLSAIPPITVAAIRPASIPSTEIAISPLAPIAELQIAPLSPPERRN